MSGISGPPPRTPHVTPPRFELSREDFLASLNPELRAQIERVVVPTQHATSVEVRHTIADHALGKRRRGAA